MNGILVRVGIDQAYGRWNAPVDEVTREFVYVPIPDGDAKCYSPGLRVSYDAIRADVQSFAQRKLFPLGWEFGFPEVLQQRSAHLDPDFCQLTYGDNGAARGKGIGRLVNGDILVFYSSLRSIQRPAILVYAIIGLYVLRDVLRARDVPAERHCENAHTRWNEISPNDIVVKARADVSGRLKRCIPIGEFRDRAYRVTRPILTAWGGLSCRDGYIQRSVVPPHLLDPQQFKDWFDRQEPELISSNNP